MAIKVITGRRQEGKTSYLLDWLWEHRDDRVAMFVPREMQKKRIMKETEEAFDVFSFSWSHASFNANMYDYSAIDDLWQFDSPKEVIRAVSECTTTEIRCTMGSGIFNITTLQEVRK